ncbi:MAG: hypothetical protein HGB26_03110 [Desulfobulbaceae bacterium]|nr:hypothetical protein [Desulfobulbaceae bacterium]
MRYPHATAHDMINPEVCLNLWAYTSEDGLIMRLAGKTYVLQGSDKEKLAVLRLLSATDFLSVLWGKVPANFVQFNPEGERLTGIASASILSDPYGHSQLFGPLIEKFASSLPEQLKTIAGEYAIFKLELPNDPLTVTTVVIEYEDGRLVPMISK